MTGWCGARRWRGIDPALGGSFGFGTGSRWWTVAGIGGTAMRVLIVLGGVWPYVEYSAVTGCSVWDYVA